MRRSRALLLVLLVAACGGRADDERDARTAPVRAAVPGLETAPVTVAPVRDVVHAFGQVMAQGESPALRDARTALDEADARLTLAEQQVRRLETLAGDAVAPRKELESARAEQKAAEAGAARARQALAAFGREGGGDSLAAGETWVLAQVLQVDVGRVAAGAEARFAPDAFPDTSFDARTDEAPAYVDPATGSAPVRLRVRDPAGRLRPGMTGAARIEVGAPRDAVVVPSAAVVYDAAQPLVFVAENGGYVSRPVRLGVTRDGLTEIAEGLPAGGRVVVTGAASLLSAARLPAGEE